MRIAVCSRRYVKSPHQERVGAAGSSTTLPLAERAALCGHAELRPGRALTYPTAAGGVERCGVPFRTGAACGFAGGEDFWRCGR